MRVAALVHFYAPFRNAGSERMLHTMLRSLVDAGHEVQAFVTETPDAPFVYEYDGVRVMSSNFYFLRQEIRDYSPDLIVTHHQNARKAIQLGRKHGYPSVFLVHNDFQVNRLIAAKHPDFIVFNTEWIRDSVPHGAESIVVHPPIWADEHRTTPGEKITLVNLNENKGGNIFYGLAESMPNQEFLGVIGGHGDQIVRRDLPNVEIVEHTDDMVDDVWSKTRVLLMPSIYESYGMAGVEAMASGIPVIAHPTPGLQEALGSAGLFVDRDDSERIKSEIRRLNEPAEWLVESEKATKRSNELDPSTELSRWVESMERLSFAQAD